MTTHADINGNILIIGQTGQLARALTRLCDQRNINYKALNRQTCDLSGGYQSVSDTLNALPTNIHGLINTAAYTAVDKAEEDLTNAITVNGEAVRAMTEFCLRRKLPMVHVSTDYVFNGQSKTPYKPEDPVDPINAYGTSKREGEVAIISSEANAAILRTSWVFDGTGQNFFTTMLRLAQTRSELNVVYNQLGRPTYAGHLAEACLTVLEGLQSNLSGSQGIFHFSNSGPQISWAEFAKHIFKSATPHLENVVTVTPIPSHEYPTLAERPANSMMDLTKFEGTFSVHVPDWRDGLKSALAEWVSDQKDNGPKG